MSYRSKLLLSLTVLVSLTSVVAGAILYYHAREALFRALQSKVLSIAATTASSIDGDLHQQIKTRDDENLPAYQELVHQLREARDANRRADTYVAYMYTMLTAHSLWIAGAPGSAPMLPSRIVRASSWPPWAWTSGRRMFSSGWRSFAGAF
ncbi:MAG: hypothetical protein P8Y94_16620 [Acidobacteriota bacterium]